MGCCGRLGCSSLTLRYLVNSHIVQSRARVSACSPTGALLHRFFPSNFSTTTHGAIVKLHGASSESCTLLSISVWNSKTALVVVRELFWGMLGRADRGLRGIGVSGSGYNAVLALEVPNVVDCVERRRRAELLASASAQRFHSRRACVCAYVHVVCVCVCVCMYVCVQTCMYVCKCMCMCICICMHVCTCVYVCVCIFVHRL
jgi:hypothetical protein